MNSDRAAIAHRVGFASLVGLIVLAVLWEWLLAPIRPGGSWLVLKALPLLIPLRGICADCARRRYTYQWSTMFILVYFAEGVVRAWSDVTMLSRSLAGLELLLCSVFFVAAIVYVRSQPSPLTRR